MEISYTNNAKDSYMIMDVSDEGEGMAKDLGRTMIEKNKPTYILPMTGITMDGRELLRCRTTGMISLADKYKDTQIRRSDLERIICGITKMAAQNVRYMISTDRISLSPKCVFIRETDGKVVFAYIPGKETSFNEELQELMEYILERLDHSDEEAVETAYSLYEASYCEGFTLSGWDRGRKDRKREETASAREPSVRKVVPYCSVTAHMDPDKVEFDTRGESYGDRYVDCNRNIGISDLPTIPSYGRVKERSYGIVNGLGVYLWKKIHRRSSIPACR